MCVKTDNSIKSNNFYTSNLIRSLSLKTGSNSRIVNIKIYLNFCQKYIWLEVNTPLKQHKKHESLLGIRKHLRFKWSGSHAIHYLLVRALMLAINIKRVIEGNIMEQMTIFFEPSVIFLMVAHHYFDQFGDRFPQRF
jgi:hypothetical protein